MKTSWEVMSPKELAQLLGVSQQELAERCGLSLPYFRTKILSDVDRYPLLRYAILAIVEKRAEEAWHHAIGFDPAMSQEERLVWAREQINKSLPRFAPCP